MDDHLLAAITIELATELRGRTLGKAWQLAPFALAIDFRAGDSRALFVSVDPALPRLHLTARRLRELEKQSSAPSNFVHALRKHLSGALLRSVAKDEGERIVRFRFESADATGSPLQLTLVAQLTGRSANLLLLDETSHVLDALRPPRGAGQQAGDEYQPPPHKVTERGRGADDDDASATTTNEIAERARESQQPISAAVEEFYERAESSRRFDARAAALRAHLRQEIERRRKLARNLDADLRAHGDADAHKRTGDLLLANLSTAEREGARVRLTDYFAEDAPTIELEIDEHATLQEEAARLFARYARAKRAAQEIEQRRITLDAELSELDIERAALERAIEARDTNALDALDARQQKAKGAGTRGGGASQNQKSGGRRGDIGGGGRAAKSKRKGGGEPAARIRRYLSSDGYEILVGRAARDNDELTFKVARSHDLWLHAADYPGSHVVVRARSRDDEVPHRTLVEAAQLAAHFSQAKEDAKVAVHHTRRKFVSKIKGAAPGLVRLASFRTIMVEPRESVERI